MSTTTISQETMQQLYYHINPTPHSEKAYQKEDPAPPIASRATIVGPSGAIAVLVTHIYNKPPFGAAEFAVWDAASGGHKVKQGSGTQPYRADFTGLTPGSRVYIQPLTVGTMAKILTPEQIAAGG